MRQQNGMTTRPRLDGLCQYDETSNAMRESLCGLIRSAGLSVEVFPPSCGMTAAVPTGALWFLTVGMPLILNELRSRKDADSDHFHHWSWQSSDDGPRYERPARSSYWRARWIDPTIENSNGPMRKGRRSHVSP